MEPTIWTYIWVGAIMVAALAAFLVPVCLAVNRSFDQAVAKTIEQGEAYLLPRNLRY